MANRVNASFALCQTKEFTMKNITSLYKSKSKYVLNNRIDFAYIGNSVILYYFLLHVQNVRKTIIHIGIKALCYLQKILKVLCYQRPQPEIP